MPLHLVSDYEALTGEPVDVAKKRFTAATTKVVKAADVDNKTPDDAAEPAGDAKPADKPAK